MNGRFENRGEIKRKRGRRRSWWIELWFRAFDLRGGGKGLISIFLSFFCSFKVTTVDGGE
jgi:hypothetical protein